MIDAQNGAEPTTTQRVARFVLDTLDLSYDNATNELFFAARMEDRDLMIAALERLVELGDLGRGLVEGLRIERDTNQEAGG